LARVKQVDDVVAVSSGGRERWVNTERDEAWRLASSAWMSSNAARRAVDSARQRPASNLDFSPESLPIVDEMLAEAPTFAAGAPQRRSNSVNHSAATSSRWGDGNSEGAISGTINTTRRSWLSENRRFTLPWCPGHALRSGSKATPRTTSRSSTMALPNGQRRGARGIGPFSFRRWSGVFPFHWPLGEFPSWFVPSLRPLG